MLSKNPMKSFPPFFSCRADTLPLSLPLPSTYPFTLLAPLDALLSLPTPFFTLRLFLTSAPAFAPAFAFTPILLFGSAAGLIEFSRSSFGIGGTGGTCSREYARARADTALLWGEGGDPGAPLPDVAWSAVVMKEASERLWTLTMESEADESTEGVW